MTEESQAQRIVKNLTKLMEQDEDEDFRDLQTQQPRDTNPSMSRQRSIIDAFACGFMPEDVLFQEEQLAEVLGSKKHDKS
jgi:hypothetical protein